MSDPEVAAGAGEEVPVVYLHEVGRRYRQGETTLTILNGAKLALWAGQSVALVAPSGAGKSTLLHIAGLLEHPDEGEVYMMGTATTALSDLQRTLMRRNDVGFVYQSHRLLPEFSALENVMMPQLVRGLSRTEATRRAEEILSYLGLKERVTHRPSELSGGEQQRVAIARATAPRPQLLFADEPTGNLDAATGAAILDLLFERQRGTGATLLVITHDPALAARCGRVLEMQDGRIVRDNPA